MDYTIVTNKEQEAALVYVVDAYNSKSGTLPVTNGVYLQTVIDSLFANYQRQKEESEQAQALSLKRRYDKLTPEQQAAVETILGEK